MILYHLQTPCGLGTQRLNHQLLSEEAQVPNLPRSLDLAIAVILCLMHAGSMGRNNKVEVQLARQHSLPHQAHEAHQVRVRGTLLRFKNS